MGSVTLDSRKSYADRLAHHRLAPGIVQRNVDELKGDAEIVAVIAHGACVRFVGAGDQCAGFGGGREQRRCLGGDDLQIIVFAGGEGSSPNASCITSPSAMTASESVGEDAQHSSAEPASTINWKARLNRKSPTRMDGLLPHTTLAAARPRRSALSSTTSSCSSVAVWMNSTAAERYRCARPV